MARIQGDLLERTITFACNVVLVADQLPNNVKGWVIGKQLLRSGTSIGANVREADQAGTDADFANKCSIARKEATETCYWIELCLRMNLLTGQDPAALRSEADELMRILGKIVQKTHLFLRQ